MPPHKQKHAGKKASEQRQFLDDDLLVVGEDVGNYILQGCEQNSHQERTDTWKTQKESQEATVLQNMAMLLRGDLCQLVKKCKNAAGLRDMHLQSQLCGELGQKDV